MKYKNTKLQRQVYAFYRGDEYVCEGTIYEIAKQMGVLPKTISFYKTPSHINRTGVNGSRLVLLDEEEDELYETV